MMMMMMKLAPAESATNAFSSKKKYETIKAVVVHVLQTTQNLVIHVAVLKRTTKKRTKNYNAHAQPLFCSSNLLFGDVLVAVAVVFDDRSHVGST